MTAADSGTLQTDVPRNDRGLATTDEAATRLEAAFPRFLERLVADADADGLVVGLDGGVETALAASFAVDAVGADDVTGLVMPAFMSHEAVTRQAEAVASSLGVDALKLHLQPLLAAFKETVGQSAGPSDDLVAGTNALSRLRMACAYYVANTTNALVVGPINRTQYLLGAATKHGETAADCLLFGDLYRTEVESLARAVGVPEELTVETSGSPLHPGESPAATLEISPEEVDAILRLHVDEGLGKDAVAERIDVDPTIVDRLREWCDRTDHKRRLPPTPIGSAR
ncbi:NAD(+) synthase [Halopiger goleimassiliensis]|uniref:NAD(+) synthase n=1 Tax=Halopiger goleimassiliensis TaxID=1293048 RepID=UPI0006782052|nr:NAD(+) synthase [Halopiger goleimassiliensis]